ncbi:MAG: tripartite tricarboxylate transporter TctB family protein [Lawsonibacter sp.]|nr:tripartite tricarboxylate transporter TctB family protein [Lawsonibacter sp.]
MKKSNLEQEKRQAVTEETTEEKVARLEQNEKKTSFVRERLFLLILAVASVAMLVPSIQMWLKKPGANAPGMFPTIVTAGMLLCDLIALFQLFRAGRRGDADPELHGWDKLKIAIGTEIPFTVFVMMAATILYVLSLSIVGFYIATFLYLIFSIMFLYKGDKSKVKQALLVAAGMDLAVYAIIDLIFQIHMP